MPQRRPRRVRGSVSRTARHRAPYLPRGGSGLWSRLMRTLYLAERPSTSTWTGAPSSLYSARLSDLLIAQEHLESMPQLRREFPGTLPKIQRTIASKISGSRGASGITGHYLTPRGDAFLDD